MLLNSYRCCLVQRHPTEVQSASRQIPHGWGSGFRATKLNIERGRTKKRGVCVSWSQDAKPAPQTSLAAVSLNLSSAMSSLPEPLLSRLSFSSRLLCYMGQYVIGPQVLKGFPCVRSTTTVAGSRRLGSVLRYASLRNFTVIKKDLKELRVFHYVLCSRPRGFLCRPPCLIQLSRACRDCRVPGIAKKLEPQSET